MRLTQRRAESIRDYLVTKGITPGRLNSVGYEATDPLISDDNISELTSKQEKEEAYQKNRRVEFKILETTEIVVPWLQLQPKPGYLVRDYSIEFYDGRLAGIHPETWADSALSFLDSNPDVRLLICVHRDYRGSNKANVKLTESWAKSIKEYLIARGINKDRIVAVGCGEDCPLKITVNGQPTFLSRQYIDSITKGKTRQEYERIVDLNNRVEFKILAI